MTTTTPLPALAAATLGRQLAQRHAGRALVTPGPSIRGIVVQLRRRLQAWVEPLSLTPAEGAAERDRRWLLDNGHIFEVGLAQVGNDLPPSFHRHLPALDGASAPRIAELAEQAVAAELEPLELAPRLQALLAGYQDIAPLSMGELWAFPSLVRLAILQRVAVLGEALVAQEAASPGLDAPACVLRLRDLAAVDWRLAFEAVSRVEATLRADPAGVYGRMDFASRDRYRKAIERMGEADADREIAAAQAAVALARAADTGSTQERTARTHVGYYLIDDGRRALEIALGYRPRGGRTRLRRALLARPESVFFGSVLVATAGLLSVFGAAAGWAGLGPWPLAALLALSLVPALTVAEALVHGTLGALLEPRVLPKLDFDDGVPRAYRTLVVFPVLFGSTAEVDDLLRGLEVNAIANPDPEVGFALLSDGYDADERETESDREVLAWAVAGVERLNERGPRDRFHLLHRDRRFNPRQGRWMGWERKRGKLEELNELLTGRGQGFATRVGDAAFLAGVRFVITLDADTLLPRGAARRLIGALAHPLNAAELSDDGRVQRGSGILQPRTEVSPESASRSNFARLQAGMLGPDLYNSAVSNLYQDLFGQGLFAGKGIYDVRAFAASLEGRIPENRILSHDLFEGLFARVAYLSDVTVYEDVPSHVLSELLRSHRWARGDWQLLPWLGRRVPVRNGGWAANDLDVLDRFKVVDNLRRSLLQPTVLALFAVGLFVLPSDPRIGSMVALGPLFAPFLLSGLRFLVRLLPARRGWIFLAVEGVRVLGRGAARVVLELSLLPVRAQVMLDAIARTLYRLTVSKKRLLEWRTAALTAQRLGAQPNLWRYITGLWAAPVAGLAVALAAQFVADDAQRKLAWPFAALWLVAPGLSWLLGRPSRAEGADAHTLREADRLRLRQVARRTWGFFERFLRPEDHWLPPDNYQEAPHGMVARRTSPTNVGCYLLSCWTAYDLGFLDAGTLAARLRNTLDTLDRLERHHGHFWNWVSTETLAPLEPRYVSTVDSGNLAAALIAVARGAEEIAAEPILRFVRAEGIADVVAILRETLAASAPSPLLGALVRQLRGLETALRALSSDSRGSREWLARLSALRDEVLPTLEANLGRWVEEELSQVSTGGEATEIAMWFNNVRRELADTVTAGRRLVAEDSSAGATWGDRQEVSEEARERIAEFRELAARAEAMALAMDFTFLFDRHRKLFRIGFDAGRGEADANHYDLLATEVRLTSLWAIAKGDVPVDHWLQLGRPYGRMAGERALLSWGGTAFEYLMPDLLLRSPRRTPLARSVAAAMRRQIDYAAHRGVPWGVSESAFFGFGADDWYQYRAFGVPGTGLQRGIGERLVVAPYASLLAISVVPEAVLDNLYHLTAEGAAGPFGFYEALDYGPVARHSDRPDVVRSFMSHHQGMILAALGNFLAGAPLVRRFHADSRVASAEILLYEEARFAPLATVRLETERWPEAETVAVPSWAADPRADRAAVQVLGNGRLTLMVSAAGGGGSRWQGTALVPWQCDPVREPEGHWIYLRDLDSGALWSAGHAPTGAVGDSYEVAMAPHQVEIHRQDQGIRLHLTVAVAPDHDVEIRLLTLSNESGRDRRLAVTSFAEVALAAVDEAARHPAFARLFVEGEHLPTANALLFRRRARSPDEVSVHLATAVVPGPLDRWTCSREAFLGRGGTLGRPAGLGDDSAGLEGATLDPAAMLERLLDLPAGERRQVAFVTAVGDSRPAVLALLDTLREIHQVEALLAANRRSAEGEAGELGLAQHDFRDAQRLLTAVLVPQPTLRPAGPWLSGQDWPGQRGLWGLGISGDLPIVLVHLGADPNRALVRSLLAIHGLWRRRSLEIDLILLDEHGEGYSWPLRDWLDLELSRTGALHWLHRRGGIFVLRADSLPTVDRELLCCAARVQLDGSANSLDALLAPLDVPLERLPPFVPVPGSPLSEEPTPELERPADLRFDNGFGGFSADGREYVVHLAAGDRTPAPWINVIANEQAGFLISESGTGYTWVGNSGENRLTPWANDPVTDVGGEALYLRDEETGAVWSPTAGPVGTPKGDYQARHAAGESRFRHHRAGLRQELTVFVPRHDPLKIVRLRLENVWQRPRRLTATYFVEWVLGSRRAVTAPLLRTDFLRPSGVLVAQNPFHPDRPGQLAFLAADRPTHGFTADRAEFLAGTKPGETPPALRRIGLAEVVGNGLDPCGALQVHVDLAPGETVEIAFFLGAGTDFEAVDRLVARYREPNRIETARAEVSAFWDQVLGAVEIATPLPALDLLTNRWLQYQNLSCRIWGRSGLYQSSGAYGFRDQLQDVCALSTALPAVAREHLLRAAARQFAAGDVLHWWHPEGWRGVRTRCSDDLLWLPFATLEYLAATGDASVLEEKVAFLTGPELSAGQQSAYDDYFPGAERASLYEHCRRALARGATRGDHGLPRIGSCDWNDGLDHVGPGGRGESVWLAWFLVVVLERFAPLAAARGDLGEAAAYRATAEGYRVAAETGAWDGAWYRRAYFDDGTPLGSQHNGEGSLDLLPQAWAAWAGAPAEHVVQALESAFAALTVPDHGLLRLLAPPFDRARPWPGYIAGYPPGVRENGGQYNHAAIWGAWAASLIGDGDRALAVVRGILPVLRATTRDDANHYRLEPYALAGDIYSAPPHAGRGGWSWYTGAAGWLHRWVIEALIGLRVEGDQLRLAPCLPSDWPGARVRYRRGATVYTIVLEANGTGREILALRLDGESVAGDRVPWLDDGADHDLLVVLGSGPRR